jgi:2-polyprenyl-6-methoxyphenol hydroxylase-like FAD-dependent oxidoreductase
VRAGVPQARHLHALLPRGLHIIEVFFPGLNDEMQAAGAVPLDTGADVAWLTPQGWGVKVKAGLLALSSSRDLLEYVIRQTVLQLASVELRQATQVTALLRDGDRIVGVGTRARAHSALTNSDNLAGDLIVVTSGRQNALPNWLSDAGIEEPRSTVINAHIGYASRPYRRSPHQQFPWRGLVLQSAPPSVARGGLMFAIEGNRWQVTLIGGDRDYPPSDEYGFLEFARSLRSPELYEAIRHAEPLTPIHAYRATENRLHHLERIKNWPGGLVVMGDAACASNPVYGQGMTTAAIQAAALSRLLTEESCASNAGKTMREEVARIVRSPWASSTGADLR